MRETILKPRGAPTYPRYILKSRLKVAASHLYCGGHDVLALSAWRLPQRGLLARLASAGECQEDAAHSS